jgi:hypothetical protein
MKGVRPKSPACAKLCLGMFSDVYVLQHLYQLGKSFSFFCRCAGSTLRGHNVAACTIGAKTRSSERYNIPQLARYLGPQQGLVKGVNFRTAIHQPEFV